MVFTLFVSCSLVLLRIGMLADLCPTEPAVDGDYIKDTLGMAFLSGRFDQTIQAVSAHNTNEGFGFTDPAATNSSALATYMHIYFPHASAQVIDHIANTLYPPIYDGSQPYKSPFARLNLLISEMMVSCNSRYLATGLGVARTYAYQFAVPPGFHMNDIPYTFYDGTLNGVVTDASMAMDLQRYITAFAAVGDPNGAREPKNGSSRFPLYGSQAELTNFNTSFTDVLKDPNDNPRCEWWQQGLFL